MKKRECTKEEFDAFLENYPRKLESDFFMDSIGYYDFSLSEDTEECCVARRFFVYEESYSIMEVGDAEGKEHDSCKE